LAIEARLNVMVSLRFVYTAYVFLTNQKFLANPEACARLVLIQRSYMMLGWRFASVSLLAADAEVPWRRTYSYEIFGLFPATNKASPRFYANQRGSVACPYTVIPVAAPYAHQSRVPANGIASQLPYSKGQA
jgi:hypothetical protein